MFTEDQLNFAFSLFTYSYDYGYADDRSCSIKAYKVLSDHMLPESPSDLSLPKAIAKVLGLRLKDLYTVCGEDEGWSGVVSYLLRNSSIEDVLMIEDAFEKVGALLLMFNGRSYVLTTDDDDGIPAIIASKDFFDKFNDDVKLISLT